MGGTFANISPEWYGEPAAAVEIEDAGVRLGEVIGWRAWRVENGWLYSMAIEECEWEPGQILEAHDVNQHHGGGIHAFKTRKGAIGTYGLASPHDVVVGRVALWGQIYEFDQGYHAEFARVHSLDWINAKPETRLVARRFWCQARKTVGKCPSTLLDQLRQTYGLTEPSDTAS